MTKLLDRMRLTAQITDSNNPILVDESFHLFNLSLEQLNALRGGVDEASLEMGYVASIINTTQNTDGSWNTTVEVTLTPVELLARVATLDTKYFTMAIPVRESARANQNGTKDRFSIALQYAELALWKGQKG